MVELLVSQAGKGAMSIDLVFWVGLGLWVVWRLYLYATPGEHPVLAREAAKKAEGKRREDQKLAAEREAREAKRVADFAADRPRREQRDADVQSIAYFYNIGQHANEALAIRYGIANLDLKDPSLERSVKIPARQIALRKTERLEDGRYRVVMPHYRNREAIAIIEPGTDYVKTFLPLDADWFSRNAGLETALKGNGTFSLKELAAFHVQRAVW